MTPTRKRRLIALLLILAGVGVASTVAFYSLQENLLYFQSPSDLVQHPIPPGRQFRLGGIDRHVKLAQKVRERPDVVLVAVGNHDPARIQVVDV